MGLDRSLKLGSIALNDGSASADAVLRRITELVKKNPLAGSVDEKAVLAALKEREALSSTGLGDGLAIPHCALDGIDDFVVGVLVTAKPVAFGGNDGKPSDLFFFIVGPRDQRNRHIKLLSAIAKTVSQGEVVTRLRSTNDPAAVRDLLLESIPFEDEHIGAEKVLFQIMMQNMAYFEDVLNLMSSAVPGSISVVETRNAGAYLFRMPLFAAFWSEQASEEGRVVMAVVDKAMTNSLIRQIHQITGDPDEQSGVVLLVQDLAYAAGSLDY